MKTNNHKNDGSPKWKSRGGLQNRCISWVGLNPITISKIISEYRECFITYDKKYPLLREENVCQEQKIFKPKHKIQTGFFFL